MNHKESISEEQLDFLREMMNIGAGNAATALEQLLHCRVEMRMPRIITSSAPDAPFVTDNSSPPVLCVKMGMVGDVTGDLFFIVPDEHRRHLTRLAERASTGVEKRGPDVDLFPLTEVGNIVAGVFLTAIHEFCRLKIYHSVPIPAIDMALSVLDETIVTLSRQTQSLWTEVELVIDESQIRAFVVMILAEQSMKTLIDSIGQAKMAYGLE